MNMTPLALQFTNLSLVRAQEKSIFIKKSVSLHGSKHFCFTFSFFIISIKIQNLAERQKWQTKRQTENKRYLHKTINWNNIMGLGCCNARCFTPYFKWRRDASPSLLAMLIYFMYVCQKRRKCSILWLLNYKAEDSFCFINCIKWRV